MKETINNIKSVYKYGKEFKKNIIFEIIGSLIGIAINIALPILAAKQIVYLTDSMWTQLIYMSIVILVIYYFGDFKTVLIRKNTQKFTVGVTEKMQNALSTEILKISQEEIDKNSSGAFISRMTSDVNELANMFTTGLGRLVGIVSSIGTFISVFIINKIVFAFYFIVAIILTIINLIKAKEVRAKDIKKRKQEDKVKGLTSELVRGTRDIKMLNAKENLINLLNDNIKESNKLYIETRNIDINYNLAIGSLKSTFEFILMILLILLVYKNNLSIAMAIALHSYKNTLMTNFMERISSLLEEVNKFNISFNRVFQILGNKEYKKETFGKKKITNIKGNFEFKNVKFEYEKDSPVLQGLNLKIKANKTYGIVGKSGEGKTTIFNLLCKMYNITDGEILINGININELDEDSIRGNITIISQNPYIFNLSIKDNLKLVKTDITDEEIEKACELACLKDFIETLPDKYDTIVGEAGVTLSGGQRQRLAIARALIQKTKIILFDEATSALDNETQTKIQTAINNMRDDYTIVIIAHRLSTIKNCDEIFFMKNGIIESKGSHKELMTNCKDYKKLYEQEIITK